MGNLASFMGATSPEDLEVLKNEIGSLKMSIRNLTVVVADLKNKVDGANEYTDKAIVAFATADEVNHSEIMKAFNEFKSNEISTSIDKKISEIQIQIANDEQKISDLIKLTEKNNETVNFALEEIKNRLDATQTSENEKFTAILGAFNKLLAEIQKLVEDLKSDTDEKISVIAHSIEANNFAVLETFDDIKGKLETSANVDEKIVELSKIVEKNSAVIAESFDDVKNQIVAAQSGNDEKFSALINSTELNNLNFTSTLNELKDRVINIKEDNHQKFTDIATFIETNHSAIAKVLVDLRNKLNAQSAKIDRLIPENEPEDSPQKIKPQNKKRTRTE